MENDIENFLIMEPLEWFEKVFDLNYKPVWVNVFKNAHLKYKKYGIILNSFDYIYNDLIYRSVDSKKPKILFDTIKYPNLILNNRKDYSIYLLARNEKDRFLSIMNRLKYININDLATLVFNYFEYNDIASLEDLVTTIETRLQIISPEIVVMSSDNSILERAIISACKILGITTVAIQHGVYSSNIPIFDGKAADYFFVWGNFFKDLYINNSIKNSKNLYVLGYPHHLDHNIKSKKICKKRIKNVYYLGQNFENYKKELIYIKLETVQSLNNICNKLNLNFFYRCHPGDNTDLLKSKLGHICFVSPRESLIESINKGDIFISFNSSSLVEAAMRSKICIQLLNYPLPSDNFEKLGACTRTLINIKELEEYLITICDYKSGEDFKTRFNNDYIDISKDPAVRFSEILKNIKDR